MSKIDIACDWAVGIAKDDSHGYDQIHRWGEDPDGSFDCSSLVISTFENAGFKVKEAGATYTGNMKEAFRKCGFEVIPYKKLMTLKRGDVVLNERHHVVLYLGGGQIVQASINEKGTTTGGRPGDQTRREIFVGGFYQYSKGWDVVLRYPETEGDKIVNVSLPELHEGMNRPEVGMVQTLLKGLGFKGLNNRVLKIDNDFGPSTSKAVTDFQKSVGLNPDCIVGAKTYTKLFESNY